MIERIVMQWMKVIQNQLDQMPTDNLETAIKAEFSEEPFAFMPNTQRKNSFISTILEYIGLTLKEYFRLHENRSQIGTIEQESCSSKEANTPGFAYQETNKKIRQNRQRKKIKTQATESLFAFDGNNNSFHKFMPLPSEQTSGNNNCLKLPYIHDRDALKKSQLNTNILKEDKQLIIRNKVCSFSSTLKQNNQPALSAPQKDLFIQEQKKVINKNHVTLSSFYKMIEKKASIHENTKKKQQKKQKSPFKDRSLQKKKAQHPSSQAKNALDTLKVKDKFQFQQTSMLKSFMITRLAMGNRHKAFDKQAKTYKAY